MAVLNDVKDILSINFKVRHDSYSDQYTRVFLMKLMIMGAFFIGLNWYNDKINCLTVGSGFDGGFATSACWINGLYIYPEAGLPPGQMGYYGIPRKLDHDGLNRDGKFCETHPKQGFDKKTLPPPCRAGENGACCSPMKRVFFLQFQYMVFLIALLALLYYAPYIMFKMVNQDLISLMENYESSTAEKILNSYFNRDINSAKKQRMRVIGTIGVKIAYIISNIAAFYILDGVLNGKYTSFGSDWIKWSKKSNEDQYNYMTRSEPKPANVLLPSFGICEIFEQVGTVRQLHEDRARLVCELNNFVLYQYVFLITWFAQIGGLIISVIGLLVQLVDHVLTMTCFMKQGTPEANFVLKRLTFREFEYLEFIRKKNLALYNELYGHVAIAVAKRGKGNQGGYHPNQMAMQDFDHKGGEKGALL